MYGVLHELSMQREFIPGISCYLAFVLKFLLDFIRSGESIEEFNFEGFLHNSVISNSTVTLV